MPYSCAVEHTRTLADLAHEPAIRSYWRRSLEERTQPLSVHEYLIDEANMRGFWGAYRSNSVMRPPDEKLELEDIVVGLLAPQAPAEARVFKLVLRILQSHRLNAPKLILRAKRERALGALYWLLAQVPSEERNAAIQELSECIPHSPRGYRALRYLYEPQRLVRRPATKEALWRRLRR
jgi:hypothetical protein